MSRRGIDRLPKPARKFRIRRGLLEDGTWFGFETRREAESEDEERCKRLLRLTDKKRPIAHPWTRVELLSLVARIQAGSTVAASTCTRKHRKRIGGNLLRLITRDTDAVRMFTLIPSDWVFPEGSLGEADAIKMIAALRQAFRRKGADKASGWLFAYIDGENDPTSKTFRLHVHGLASGEMVDVVEKMKEVRNLQPAGLSAIKGAVGRPVLSQKIVRTPMRVATYPIKGFWCERPVFEVEGRGPKRPRGRRRISNLQAFAEHLLWLDRWRLQDLSLMMGMSVGKKGLKIRKTVHLFSD